LVFFVFVVTFFDFEAQTTTPTLTLGIGKVVARDGPTAAHLAAEIVKRIRASCPLTSAES
jgi:hypothetical protein